MADSSPAPLPDIREDPSLAAAQDAQAAYSGRVATINGDHSLSDLARAEQISAAYQEHAAELSKLQNDLAERRVARVNHLKAQIPVGPGVPDDASPADRAVLTAAFMASLDKARGTLLPARQAMLADALRFGDDAAIRAVLTSAEESGYVGLFDQWATATGNTETLNEIRAVDAQLAGMDRSTGAWEGQAFRAPARPHEDINLPVMRQKAEAEHIRRSASAARIASHHH